MPIRNFIYVRQTPKIACYFYKPSKTWASSANGSCNTQRPKRYFGRCL